MHRPVLRLAVVAAVVAGLAATASSAAVQAATDRTPTCGKGDFCLFAGPHQTGRVLLVEPAQVTKNGFDLRELDDIEPAIRPKSVRNPLPDGFGCIVRLNDKPRYGGDEQEVSGFGDHELDGRRVASLTPDCG